ncbi:MAG: MFS transporter [Deltaproteobacteria bacterium]|nr:MFS transporter [Deltaproteobacteria bacterium]
MMTRPRPSDWWLAGVCVSRAFSQAITLTYAAAIPVLQHEWGMTAARAGTISSGYQIGYGLSLFFVSIAADRLGAKRIYLWSNFTAAVFSLTFALFARDYLSGLILFTLVAVAMGGNYTTGLMILADQYPVQERGRATGFYIASSSLGLVLSLVLSGWAIPAGGYPASFFLAAVCSGLGCILAWITLIPMQPSERPTQERQTLRSELLANRPALLLIGAYTCHCWELLGMWAWTPAFLAAYFAQRGMEGVGAAGVGSYVTASFHVAGIFASFWMGSLSDRLGRGRVILIASGLSTLCSFVFGWSIEWTLGLVMVIGLLYAFSALGDSPVLSVALTEVVSPFYLGTAFGVRSLLGFGAGAVSPVIFGAVLDWTNPQGQYVTWGWAFATLGLPGLGTVWAAYRMKGREQ